MSGGTEFIRAEEKQREILLEDVSHLLPEGIENEELQAHFATLPARYFQIHSARDIMNDLLLTHRFMRQQISEEDTALVPVVNWHNELDRGYNAVKVCTWDRAGLFSKIAGSFSVTGLNILSAQIFTRTDGIVLDTFFVIDARTGNLSGAEQRDKFESVLNRALSGEGVDFHPMILKQKLVRPAYHAYTGERISTQVRFDNDASETRTLIEIETEDRIGLLYEISQTFSELDLDISAAKISTEKGAAIDTFYVRELNGGKVVAPERHRAIERKLRHAIHTLDSK
jgi:[protein-PII] uridylyltransferase